jgi:hypothetical protein
MTDHPCRGLSRAQISAFEAIAINRLPNCSKRTIEKLLAHGAIATQERNIREDLPPSVFANYYVPLCVHIQWCEWAEKRHHRKL